MFCPGETIRHTFIIPFYSGDINHVIVTYKQNDDIFLEKSITSGFSDGTEQGKTIVQYTLSQQESLLFPEGFKYDMQVNVFTRGGSRHSSHPFSSKTSYQFHQDVLNIISGGGQS